MPAFYKIDKERKLVMSAGSGYVTKAQALAYPRQAPRTVIPLHLRGLYSSGTLRLKWWCGCATIRHRLRVTVPRKTLMNSHL